MLVIIDLMGDDEEITDKKKDDVAEKALQEQKTRDAWNEWMKWHEQVTPQIIPVEET